jgi:8-oxo-dGTP pyrophosphatase MutT (NUDIX family)
MHWDDRELRLRLGAPTLDWRSEPGLRDAAVVLPLVRRPEGDTLLFTLRRPDLAAHAGQISFPGGGREGDEDPLECALREAEEEVGLVREDAEVLGRLPDRVSIADYLVAPFVVRVRSEPVWRPDPGEVAEAFELPVAGMLDQGIWRLQPSRSPKARFARVPAMDLEGRTVWGLTGIILRDFLRRAAAFDPGE